MRLFLMRHASASDRGATESSEETDPGLTPDGAAKARAAARGLVKLGIEASVLLTSPLLRAVQTAEIVSQEFGMRSDQLRRTDALKPGGPPSRLGAELSGIETNAVLCVGHSPQLDDLISYIVDCRSRVTMLKKVAVACLELDSISPPRGVLLWLLPQKVLRRLGK